MNAPESLLNPSTEGRPKVPRAINHGFDNNSIIQRPVHNDPAFKSKETVAIDFDEPCPSFVPLETSLRFESGHFFRSPSKSDHRIVGWANPRSDSPPLERDFEPGQHYCLTMAGTNKCVRHE